MTIPPMPVKEKRSRKPRLSSVPDYILFVLGVAGLVLSGWSLGTLLHDTAGAPWAVAVFAVAVFDLVALASGVLVYLRRADPWAAGGARLTMTLALLASAVVNGAHGAVLGGWTTAAVLAAAPLAFEVVFELRHRTLTALVWVLFRKESFNRLRFDAWTRIAIVAGDTRLSAVEGSPEVVAETIQRLSAQSPALTGGSPAQLTETSRLTAHETSAQVDELVTRLKNGEVLTKTSAADLLGVSPATAGRRLKEARDQLGPYL